MTEIKDEGVAKAVAPVTPDDWKPKASQVWTITDKDYSELCRVSSDVHVFITKDEHFVTVDTPSSYYEFDCVAQHEFARHIEVGNHIIFEDDENFIHDMTMRKVTLDTKSVRTRVYCENGGMDLNNEFATAFKAPAQPQTLEWYLNSAGNPLYDTPIKLTVNELADQKRTLSNDSNDTKQLQRLITLTNAFGDAEYRLHAKLANGGRTLPVLQQNLEIKKRLGYDIANTFLIDDYNLKQLTAESDITELTTAIYPLGSEKDGKYIDITNIVYDDGTYFSLKGENFIKNRVARDEWSYLRDLTAKDGRGYIVRRYSYDTDNAQTLFNRALTELKKYDHLTTAYEATGRIMSARLGDTIMIATHKTPKPIYLKSRVIQKKISYVDEHATQYILGQFQVQVSNISKKLQDIQDTVNSAVSRYTWIRYADDASGGGMSPLPAGKKYIGIAYNMPTALASDNPNDYTWSKFVGEDGHQGVDGKDGTTKYMWLKYADNIQGGGMSDLPDGKLYIGFAYNKDTPTESNNPQDYAWSAMFSEDAYKDLEQKIAGVPVTSVQGTEPSDPKAGDNWFQTDVNGKVIGFKIWDDTTKSWLPRQIDQDILVINKLVAVDIEGSTITGSTIQNSFDNWQAEGALLDGVVKLEGAQIRSDYHVDGNATQTGWWYINPSNFNIRKNFPGGNPLSNVSLDSNALTFNYNPTSQGSFKYTGTLALNDLISHQITVNVKVSPGGSSDTIAVTLSRFGKVVVASIGRSIKSGWAAGENVQAAVTGGGSSGNTIPIYYRPSAEITMLVNRNTSSDIRDPFFLHWNANGQVRYTNELSGVPNGSAAVVSGACSWIVPATMSSPPLT